MVTKLGRDLALETVRNRRFIHFSVAVIALLGLGLGIAKVYWASTFCLFVTMQIAVILFAIDTAAIRQLENTKVAPRSYADTIS